MITSRSSHIKQTIPILITIFFLSFPAYSKYSDGTIGTESAFDEEQGNSQETEGTAHLKVRIVRRTPVKPIRNRYARVRLLDAKDRHEVRRIEKVKYDTYIFTDIPAGTYIVEAYLWDMLQTEFENVTLAAGEIKKIAIVSKIEQYDRIRVAGKLLDKRTGRGIEGAKIHFSETAITYPDGSFATYANRLGLHQNSVRLNEKASRNERRFGIEMSHHINEVIATNLQIHIDPEHLPQEQNLRDNDGYGILCDGIDCVICNPVQLQNQQQLLQNPQELKVRLKQLQTQILKLEKELQALVQAKQVELQPQAEQVAIEAKNRAKTSAWNDPKQGVPIPVAGMLLDKRTGRGIEGATVYFGWEPYCNTKTNPDGSFEMYGIRNGFHQTYFWLDEKGLKGNLYSRLRLRRNIDEEIAANLQIHINPERLFQHPDLRDDYGDGIICDGIHCVICNSEQSQTQQQWLQTLQAIQVQLKQLQIEKQNLQHELLALEY